jgi:histone deacetylase 1/2
LRGKFSYTLTNVARCWTYETSLAVNVDVDDSSFVNKIKNQKFASEIPSNDYLELESFAPDYRLHFDSSTTMKNENTPEYLQSVM